MPCKSCKKSRSLLSNIQITISVIININGTSFRQTLLVCCFIRGAFSEEPPLPKYDVIWKQQKILEYLDNLRPTELLIINELASKINTLMILMSQKSKPMLLNKLKSIIFKVKKSHIIYIIIIYVIE